MLFSDEPEVYKKKRRMGVISAMGFFVVDYSCVYVTITRFVLTIKYL